jgi:hypothetical protein
MKEGFREWKETYTQFCSIWKVETKGEINLGVVVIGSGI